MSRRLDLVQQYAGTFGHCHLWALAIREALGEGEVVTLMAKDDRTFESHDWPSSEPLELHHMVLLGNGRMVDAEGVQDKETMLGKFGIRRGYKHAFGQPAGAMKNLVTLETAKPEWHEAVLLRRDVILSLGWKDEVPEYDGALTKNWKSVQKKVVEDGVPEPEIKEAPPCP